MRINCKGGNAVGEYGGGPVHGQYAGNFPAGVGGNELSPGAFPETDFVAGRVDMRAVVRPVGKSYFGTGVSAGDVEIQRRDVGRDFNAGVIRRYGYPSCGLRSSQSA